MYAALTTEWSVPEQSLYIFYRGEKLYARTYNRCSQNDNSPFVARIKNCFRDAAVYLASALSRVDTAAVLILRVCSLAAVPPIIRNPFRPARWQRSRLKEHKRSTDPPNPRKSSIALASFIEYNTPSTRPPWWKLFFFLHTILRLRFSKSKSVTHDPRFNPPCSSLFFELNLPPIRKCVSADLILSSLNFDEIRTPSCFIKIVRKIVENLGRIWVEFRNNIWLNFLIFLRLNWKEITPQILFFQT